MKRYIFISVLSTSCLMQASDDKKTRLLDLSDRASYAIKTTDNQKARRILDSTKIDYSQ